MRKHGWQPPYHPLQVVAVAVFLALGFAFYVFFAPFVGKKLYQYIVMGVYTPIIMCVFGLYIWSAAADPADAGVFKSKKYLKALAKHEALQPKNSKLHGESASSVCDPDVPTKGQKSEYIDGKSMDASVENLEAENTASASPRCSSWLLGVLCFPCSFLSKCLSGGEESSDRDTSEDGMFYCSLCKVEVFKYSKHCRVCDKCVDSFDHHCRWLNNCVGKKNYLKFFALMVFSLLMLILQWSTGILVLICCFLDRKRFSEDIVSKLGSSFTIVPYVIVVIVCTILAIIATLPLAQLFFFHILLIRKGLSTYDYIIALREQEQQAGGGGQQSPQMSQVSSLTGLSSVSSFNTFNRGAWCTPPRLFVEDQYDVVPPDTGSVSSYGKKMAMEESNKKKNQAVKISPWTLARLNAEDVSKAASEARKKSKILQPISSRREALALPLPGQETDSSYGSSGRQVNKRKTHKRIPHEQLVGPSSTKPPASMAHATFRPGFAISSSVHMEGSSPESSLDSPDHHHPFRVSSSGADEARKLTGLRVGSGPFTAALPGIQLSRSTSDGYDASGGEDSDRVGGQMIWSSVLFGSNHDTSSIAKLKAPSSSFANANFRRQ
ncbi:hypothetical protein V2J09_019955 [Rumex salicifolius]